ncbi:MAG: glucosamine--fructose-6-phosphate aminotransferase [Pelagibacteraceae bacterium BACL5 MAG-120820-bin39]|jgi:glutamine---fructose-6-phosphate transaminase (isomerizing)|nr:MAG: glucosamine--fructose-6-phosphate aminotransferase [Pelagibacteraceae bacterium BACL5 MAG-120820-bin39]
MCGIIGITSNKTVSAAIINSLKKLEYRGYDSAGVATIYDGVIKEVKSEGRVENLEQNSLIKSLEGTVGIGHVRWATHGVPNSINAHPHSSSNVSVVHNGIIENSTILKKFLEGKGHVFKSQTDTEVIVHLISEHLKTKNILNSITTALKQLHGSYALGILFKDEPDLIIGARRGSPLAVGYGPNENYLGSDSYALKSMTNKITYLEDGEFCFIKKDQVSFYNEKGIKINKKVLELSSNQANYEKGDFKHFMAKEIEEQPVTISNGIKEYVDQLNNEINIYNFPWSIDDLNSIKLIGCGTAYHSCLMAKYWFEELTSLDVSIDIASEFRYRKNKFKKDCLYIFVSQSGETADTYAALDLCKQNKMKTCAVVNSVESSIARDSNFVLPIHCGPEIGVASTKAFLGQILILYILTLKFGYVKKDLSKKIYQNKIKDLKKLPKLIEKTLLMDNKIQNIVSDLNEAKGSMFLGRGFSYPIALEGALKLKELSYIHAEGYPAGEMKHGPLALIEEGMPVIVLAPRDSYYKKTISNMQEVIARGAKVLLITNKSKDEILSENLWETLEVETTNDDLLPFLITIPLQKLAYYSALQKGFDIDKPRNLAKSVTVE